MTRRSAELTTDRLTLRPLRSTDADRLAALAGAFEVARMTARIPHPYGLTDAAWWIEHGQHQGRHFAVIRAGELIGCCGLDPIERHAAELGYWIGVPHWGQGFATEAARATVAHGFTDLGCEVLHSGHFVDNPASGRVLAKCGFVAAGTRTTFCRGRSGEVEEKRVRLDRATWKKTGGRQRD